MGGNIAENIDVFALLAALLFANLFFILRFFDFFKLRPFIKSGMAIALAAMCFFTKVPIIWMGIGFLLSALGDWFLDLGANENKDKWFMPGLVSFFLAHIAFLIFLWPNMSSPAEMSGFDKGLIGVIFVLITGFFIWLKPGLPKNLVLPVALYSLIIALMGIAAFNSKLPSIYIPIGAAAFIISDMVLAIDKFRYKIPFGGAVNWALYAGGQILLALGALVSLV